MQVLGISKLQDFFPYSFLGFSLVASSLWNPFFLWKRVGLVYLPLLLWPSALAVFVIYDMGFPVLDAVLNICGFTSPESSDSGT
jgi:glucan phosphoethanolaminetransferase (alkaline phosphatase superfamily)